jgi:hypothetical protein
VTEFGGNVIESLAKKGMRVIALATALAHVETSFSLRQLIDATNNPTCRFLTLSFSPEMAES